MKKKLKSLLLGALATTALLISGGASANGNNPNLYLGLNSNGTLTFGITIGQPQHHTIVRHVAPQPVHYYHRPVRYQRQHRNWRPVVRHHRPHYRAAPVVYYQPVRPVHYRGNRHHH